jgi:O-methyltransferase
MSAYAAIYQMTERTVFAANSFDGLPVSTHENDISLKLSKDRFPELAVSLDTVRENFDVYGLATDKVKFLKRWFKETLPSAPIDKIALLRIDGDLYESAMDALTALYHKVSLGGIVIVDDYHAVPACKQAALDYFDVHDLALPVLKEIDWTGVWWVKQTTAEQN